MAAFDTLQHFDSTLSTDSPFVFFDYDYMGFLPTSDCW